jgi:hypothetical protein
MGQRWVFPPWLFLVAMTAFAVIFASGVYFLSTGAERAIAFVVGLLVSLLIGLVGGFAAGRSS